MRGSTGCSTAQWRQRRREDLYHFASVDLTPPIDANGNFQNNQTYQPGGPGDIVVVRLFYQWPIYVSLLQNMSGNKRLLVATAAFRNEPYHATTPTPPSP